MADDRTAGDPYEALGNRSSVSYLMRNTQQHLVSLSAQADLKANIVITASSILLTVGVTKLQEKDLRVSVAILSVGCLTALVLAILSVLPSSAPRERAPGEPLNPLFFVDAAEMDREQYVAAIAAVAGTEADLYRAQAEDLHEFSVFLAKSKYRRLRRAYVAFLLGVAVATVHQLVQAFR